MAVPYRDHAPTVAHPIGMHERDITVALPNLNQYDPPPATPPRPGYLAPPPEHGPVEHHHLRPKQYGPMASPSSDEILAFLRKHKTFLQHEYGGRQIALFGSALYDELEDDSDIDILVDLDKLPDSATYHQCWDITRYLEDRLHRTVDVVERDRLFKHVAPYIEGTAFHV